MGEEKFFDAGDHEQNRYLTEGCCPNRHGPLLRIDENMAVCPQCKKRWRSDRIAVIWPKRLKETA